MLLSLNTPLACSPSKDCVEESLKSFKIAFKEDSVEKDSFPLFVSQFLSGLPILGEFYEEYAPTNDILYFVKTSSTCCALFDVYANNNSEKLSHWTSYFVKLNEDSFRRRQNISNDVYLVGFLASWLSGFVLLHSSNYNEVRPSTFVVARKMARGSIFSLTVPVLAYLYQCFNKVVVSSHPGKTNVLIELPSPQFLSRLTEPYARLWIASSFVTLQFSPNLNRKHPNPQSKTPKKKIKKLIILDNPYSPPRQSTLPTSPSRCSSSKSSKSSSLMSLPMRPCPNTTIRSSLRRYPQQYLLNILETRCHHFCGRLIHFEFEDPKVVPSPLEMTFPESFNHPAEGPSSLMQFKSYIDSPFDGEDSIFEGKDAQAVIDKFENGREFLILGRVKAKSIGTPSHSMSSEYSASISNYFPEESKNDVIEVEDEDDDLYDYTALSNCSPKRVSPSKFATSPSAMVTFKGEVSFDNLVDPAKLEGLNARTEKPPAQSNPISSNEAASHIQ
ncbi:hypothetical protein Vadar_013730 [Vaccinium darrowii]|uniref:Uncharacterized protein n=1 Tax=Vaccinium darrowii TaxID=229202 RepID=A0ACB7YDQ0_9ERIC|nr:hypothetical protein Vadar_013730 [Vaccinium darrowii]